MKKTTFVHQINLALSIAALAGVIYLSVTRNTDQTAYIDLGKVFNEFELTQTLNKQLNRTMQVRQHVLDSLELRLRTAYQQLKSTPPDDQFMALQQMYQAKQQQFEEENRRQSEEYDEQIWKQLNTYVRNYASEHNIDLLLGGKGDGSLMYGAPEKEITNDVLEYVNKQYKGL